MRESELRTRDGGEKVHFTREPEDLGDFQIISRDNALLALVIAFIVGVVLQRVGFF